MSASVLKFLTCGEVDDGKSSLLGRLLFEVGSIPQDTVESVKRLSAERGFKTPDGRPAIDHSLFFDGLLAEREQGITIDVAWKYFQTPRRKFIVADCPGHVQYTRNMVTGASQCSAAVVLLDASRGIRDQTRRHVTILGALGLTCVLFAINKLDLVGWERQVFEALRIELTELAVRAGLRGVMFLPTSAMEGANLLAASPCTPWYTGPSLLSWLETVTPEHEPDVAPLRIPVQLVLRWEQKFRGYAGTVGSGQVRVGDEVTVLPLGAAAKVTGILVGEESLSAVRAGTPVVLTLDRDIDVSRGDVFVAGDFQQASCTDQFEATLVWLDQTPLMPGRLYELRLGTASVPATVTGIRHRINLQTGVEESTGRLDETEIGRCELALDRKIVCDLFRENRDLGAFLLVDRISNNTVAAGMLTTLHGARIVRQRSSIDKSARAAMKGQEPYVIWFTGLSGSGKSTLANGLEVMLAADGRHTFLLDGDNLRSGLNRDLGFSPEARVENIRRAGEVARLMVEAGLIVLVAFISPFRAERFMVRELLGADGFFEVYVSTPLAECERRDVKGLYKQARAGKVPNFSGISSAYEPPESPELAIDTSNRTISDCVQSVYQLVTAGRRT